MNDPDEKRLRLPSAVLKPKRRFQWVWVLPIASAVIVCVLIVSAILGRGIPITIDFRQGYGLKSGDAVRYRGIEIGTVREIRLSEDLNGIEAGVRLHRSARDIAREGTRFWIERPRLNLDGVAGLDTVIGAKYVNALPGHGEYARRFIGMDHPPFMESLEAGGLEIFLQTPNKGGLQTGAPVTYRDVAIGAIMEVDLARDISSVEAHVYIMPEYAPLIRENTLFWKSGGAKVSAGIGGFSVDLDSLRALMRGGVNVAVPPDAGKKAAGGHRFVLHEKPEREWLEWKPYLDIREKQGPELPRPIPVALKWRRWFREKSRSGWALPVENGLLGPTDILTPPRNRKSGEYDFFINGKPVPQEPGPEIFVPDIALLPFKHGKRPWPSEKIRKVTAPEDILVVTGDAEIPRFVSAGKLKHAEGYWHILGDFPLGEQWRGACVVSDKDGALVGMIVEKNEELMIKCFGK